MKIFRKAAKYPGDYEKEYFKNKSKQFNKYDFYVPDAAYEDEKFYRVLIRRSRPEKGEQVNIYKVNEEKAMALKDTLNKSPNWRVNNAEARHQTLNRNIEKSPFYNSFWVSKIEDSDGYLWASIYIIPQDYIDQYIDRRNADLPRKRQYFDPEFNQMNREYELNSAKWEEQMHDENYDPDGDAEYQEEMFDLRNYDGQYWAD